MKKFSHSLGNFKLNQPDKKVDFDTELAKKVKGIAEHIFNEYPTEERTRMVMRFIERPLNDEFVRKILPDFTLDSVTPRVVKIASLDSAESYSATFLEIFRPVLELAHTHPAEFADMRRRIFLAGGEFTKVNQILSYGISGDDLHIHFAPAEDMNPRAALSLFETGLRDLVATIEKHPEVRVISATSWMVTRLKDVLESDRFQFTFEGLIDEETRKEYFPLENRPVSRASIPREKFITKYGGIGSVT
jgi:hypothetical protein